MPQFDIGRYTYWTSHNPGVYILPGLSGAEDSITSFDNILHQLLEKFFNERLLNNSEQLKIIMKLILKQERALSKYFSNEALKTLSFLWIAVLAGYDKSAELLVLSGADVNVPFGRRDPQVIDKKWTILHLLIHMYSYFPDHERLIRLVVDHGANLKARDHNRQTVLHYAIERGQVEMTKILLEKGANVNTVDHEGMTPLLKAVSNYRDRELLPLLMKHGAFDFAKSIDGKYALHNLVSLGTQELAVKLTRFLIEKGVSVHEAGDMNCQPIHYAAEAGRNELVKLYLDHGADVNALSEGPHTRFPLYCAAITGHSSVMATLLKRGANIHLRSSDRGRTALHAACEYVSNDNKSFNNNIRQLLSAGADVLAEDHNGQTPFELLILASPNMEQHEIQLMIRALALKKAIQPSIKLKDEMIIRRYQNLQDYYRKCPNEIERMKSTRFIDSCTFFELFAKSRCQIAALMRNPEFETKFRLYDLNNTFLIYYDDIRRAFGRALRHYHSLLEQEDVINEAVYGMLPYLVVRKVVHYIEVLQECEIRNVY